MKKANDRINALVQEGKFAIMSTLSFEMLEKGNWGDATPQYNLARLRRMKGMLASKGLSFVPASMAFDPYALLVLGGSRGEVEEVAKEAGINFFFAGSTAGNFHLVTNASLKQQFEGIEIEGRVLTVPLVGLRTREVKAIGDSPTHYFEMDPRALGWIGAWGRSRANELEGVIQADKITADEVIGGGRTLKIGHMASLVKIA
jgi:hypothetical protein